MGIGCEAGPHYLFIALIIWLYGLYVQIDLGREKQNTRA